MFGVIGTIASDNKQTNKHECLPILSPSCWWVCDWIFLSVILSGQDAGWLQRRSPCRLRLSGSSQMRAESRTACSTSASVWNAKRCADQYTINNLSTHGLPHCLLPQQDEGRRAKRGKEGTSPPPILSCHAQTYIIRIFYSVVLSRLSLFEAAEFCQFAQGYAAFSHTPKAKPMHSS